MVSNTNHMQVTCLHSLSLLVGQTNTTLDVLISADDVPELDEIFNISLLIVSNPNQRLATSGVGSEHQITRMTKCCSLLDTANVQCHNIGK